MRETNLECNCEKTLVSLYCRPIGPIRPIPNDISTPGIRGNLLRGHLRGAGSGHFTGVFAKAKRCPLG